MDRTNTIDATLVGGEVLFREGLRHLLKDSPIRVTGSLPGLEALIGNADDAPPADMTVAIFLDMPPIDPSPAAGLKRLMAERPALRLVVLVSEESMDQLMLALDLGFHALLPRGISKEALIQSIALVMLGENVFPTRLAARLIGGTAPPRAAATPGQSGPRLTPREAEILQHLVEGEPNKVIARRLGIAEATVKVQVRRLLKKIHVGNRTQAAIWALGRTDRAAGMNGAAHAGERL